MLLCLSIIAQAVVVVKFRVDNTSLVKNPASLAGFLGFGAGSGAITSWRRSKNLPWWVGRKQLGVKSQIYRVAQCSEIRFLGSTRVLLRGLTREESKITQLDHS
jgi:hypothetical protein